MADPKRLEKAEKLLQKGKLDAALDEYLRILREEPANDAVRQAAADLCVSLNRTVDALTLLGILFDRYAALSDAARTALIYKKLARLSSPSALVEQTFRYAEICEKSNRKEALEAYDAALRGFIAADRRHDALRALERMVALDPNADNVRQEAEFAAQLGHKHRAVAGFLRLGEIEKRAGNDPSRWYERAYSLDPTNSDAVLGHGRALLAKGNIETVISVLAPLAKGAGQPEAREAYGRALLAANRLAEAEPFIWEIFERDPSHAEDIRSLLAALFASGESEHALALARKLEGWHNAKGSRREFMALLKQVTETQPPSVQFLEYMAELFNSSNREHDYSQTLLHMFEMYYAAGNFLKAADCLDRAAEVDAYESGHERRLEMLRGKIDAAYMRTIAGRIAGAAPLEETQPQQASFEKEPTILEDLMLQAEIFLQYSLRSKAVERLERINKLFPREEEKNQKLREIFIAAAFVPHYEGAAPEAAKTGSVPTAVANENAVDNIARVNEITRNIYRQGNVKSVLFTAVNDVGRHWAASRCVAGLCTPGKPPSAALEYCAPGTKQSDVMSIVKLITTLQGIAVSNGVLVFDNAGTAPALEPIRQHLGALGIESLLAVPLCDGDEHVGILILQQCHSQRIWRPTDVVVLRTIADQIVLAVHNARLRSLVKNLAVTEEKSGLLKRSSYLDVLLSEVSRALHQNSAVTVLLLEFGKAAALLKEIGETAVNDWMQQIGHTVCSHIRQNDLAVRYALSTVAVILADTDERNALLVVEKLRKVLAATRPAGIQVATVIAAGLAEAVIHAQYDPEDIVTEVINRAEAALDAARAAGGDCTKALAPGLESAASAD